MTTSNRIFKIAKFAAVLLTVFFLTSASAQTVVASRTSRRVVVSIPDRKLAVLEGGNVLRTFSVAVGAQVSPSPTGEFAIVDRLANPTYYHPGVIIPAGADNPIGPRWIGLNRKGYGIHGTNEPKSIGKAASHGCIRLRNREIKQLFSMLRVGDTVEIHAERDQEVSRIFAAAPAEITGAYPAQSIGAGGQ